MNLYKKSNLKLATTIFATTALLSLTSCGREEPDRTTAYGKAKYDVSVMTHEIHLEYLNCYPLAPSQKKACTEKVSDKWLKPKFEREYNKYSKTFQHEAERLGFKYFLNGKGFVCDKVLQSPIFDNKEDAYLVICSSDKQYYMQFDYDNQQWNMKDQNGRI